MSTKTTKPFMPNEAQRKWLASLTSASSYVKGASITIAELHQLLDAGLLVLSNTRAGYSRVEPVEMKAAA